MFFLRPNKFELMMSYKNTLKIMKCFYNLVKHNLLVYLKYKVIGVNVLS